MAIPSNLQANLSTNHQAALYTFVNDCLEFRESAIQILMEGVGQDLSAARLCLDNPSPDPAALANVSQLLEQSLRHCRQLADRLETLLPAGDTFLIPNSTQTVEPSPMTLMESPDENPI